MIEYRPFHNSDPPAIFAVWKDSGLGRGAVQLASTDPLETMVFAQPYFDRDGLIVACDESRVIGFVHAGFGVVADESRLDRERGVICVVMVHPDYRRRGIGRELIRRAEEYLSSSGATSIQAGAAAPCDPFYFGLYGGSAMAGFLESDPDAAPFFQALGYQPTARHLVYQCDLNDHHVPVSVRLMEIRRKMELRAVAQPDPLTWWWSTRYGRLESLRFLLGPKAGGLAAAGVTVVALDHYLSKWQSQSIGLTDLAVPKAEQRQGFGQALILGVMRRLRDELFTQVECHAPDGNEAAKGLLESCGFKQVDAGSVFQRPSD
ncbi:MAG: GNAT family N-acetyltransferase [Planctomycetaceae bacterium]|nr:GNAT family N-acetyltransferase [Planctomycetaceae bacterium]MBT6157724.1 GNAT family N-acetyltransferase [Planctomycetaceae bacterium]MBT6484853.1 GNAT family N-acetyltransferase [Planctomycetaceae bacterium]MBT6497675.1 GNAT family N-acetyltransferase [Planctomycetaceae bacterium]